MGFFSVVACDFGILLVRAVLIANDNATSLGSKGPSLCKGRVQSRPTSDVAGVSDAIPTLLLYPFC